MKIVFCIAMLLSMDCVAQSSQEADRLYDGRKYAEARQIYLKEINTLSATQLQRLGNTYLYADYKNPDYKSAKAVYEKAAEKGDGTSMFVIAEILAKGLHGEPKDTVAAFNWIKKSAETPPYSGLMTLASYYTAGKWTKKDLTAAKMIYEKILSRPDIGPMDAQNGATERLALIYDELKDYKAAVPLLEKMYDKPYYSYMLGNYYREGKGVSKDEYKATEKYYDAFLKSENQKLLDILADSLKPKYAIPSTNIKSSIDKILTALSEGFTTRGVDTKRPHFLSRVINSAESNGMGFDMDAMSKTAKFYFYPYTSQFLFSHIKHVSSSNVPADANMYAFSGLINHAIKDKALAEAEFNTWTVALQQAYPQFKFTPAARKEYGKRLTMSLFGEGFINNKQVFLELKLRTTKNLYSLEFIAKDRRYIRND